MPTTDGWTRLRPPPKLDRGASRASRAIHRQYRLRYRIRVAVQAERTHGYVLPKNDREWRFCGAFVRTVLSMALKEGGRVNRRVILEAGKTAIREAGYPEKRDHAVRNRAEQQLALPRTQAGIMEIFERAGVDVAAIATTFAEMLAAPLGETVQLDDDGKEIAIERSGVSAGDKIKVADLFFRVTTGYAPTKNASVTANVPVDAFYDENAFKKTPPIKTVGGKA